MARATLQYLRRFEFRTSGLVSDLQVVLPPASGGQAACAPLHRSGRLFLVIRLLGLWSEFSRQLVVLSALGGLVTTSGTVLAPAPGVSRFSDIASTLKKPLSGPGANWHWPTYSVGAAQDLKVANYTQISLGLGSANIQPIMAVRNFLAHPGHHSATEYRNFTQSIGLRGYDPDDLVLHKIPGGATLFETWVKDVQNAAASACQ